MDIIEKDSIITDNNQNKYFVFNTVKHNEKDYAVCVEYENPKNVVVFEYRFGNGELEIRKEEDSSALQLILASSLNKND